MNDVFEISIKDLKFGSNDGWITGYREKNGSSIEVHPIYLALRGDFRPLEEWCAFRKDIWLMERISYALDVYRSLIRYGQLEPIVITRDNVIVTGEKRACCMLIMGKEKIKAIYASN